MRADVIVVGGGIVGLSTAYKVAHRYPHRRVVVLEKEPKLALHQTGRNSGVIHSGIYYRPGSLKAKTCRDGRQQLIEFCLANGVDYDICGKLIVALDQSEVSRLEKIFERGHRSGVSAEWTDREQMRDLEPHVAGIRGIRVHDTGIVDYVGVCSKLAMFLTSRGHIVSVGSKVSAISESTTGVRVTTNGESWEAALLVNCAGLYSDRIARLSGVKSDVQIVPFRGEYYKLRPEAARLCRNLIYPVPDPEFPFLGVHFTRLIHGGVECGPNAVLAFAREGYRKTSLSPRDLIETLSFRGFRRLAGRHLRMGLGEMHRSISKRAFVRALQRLTPEIRVQDLEPIEPGIRAQAVLPDGSLLDDFRFEETHRTVHVVNAVSPAATACLAIADAVVEKLAERI